MQVPAKLQALCDEMRESFSAGQFYVVDIDKSQENGLAGTLVFGMRDSKVPALAARVRAANALGDLIQEPVEAEVLTTAEEELEYLFDRYLRPYIATHDGIVNIETIDEPGKQLWISNGGRLFRLPILHCYPQARHRTDAEAAPSLGLSGWIRSRKRPNRISTLPWTFQQAAQAAKRTERRDGYKH